jgi:hypothetical protein
VFANPYYAAGLVGALIFWIWPAFLYNTLVIPLPTAALMFLFLFFGAGWAGTEIHLRYIAPRDPPKGNPNYIALVCALIVGLAWLTRFAYDARPQ